MKEDPLHKAAKDYSVEGCNFAEVGLVLKLMVCETELEISEVVKHAKTTPVGTVASEVPPDVLPLPLPIASAAEHRIYTLIKNGMPVKEISKSFVKSIHTAGVGAWLFLLITIRNFMQFGSASVTPWSAPVVGCVTAAQQGALEYLEEQAKHFVDQPGVVPGQDWRAYLRARAAWTTRATWCCVACR